jgi:gliding motility-associated-like protein
MQKYIFFLTFFFCSKGITIAQVVINEVNLIPAPDGTAVAVQSLRECSSATAGSEYIELYNTNPCESVDISCFIIGTSGFLNSQTGTFRFPAGTVIPPLGFVSIGGPNSGATFNLFTFCGSPNMASNNNRWYLNNGSHFVMLFDDNGTPVDAVYWANNAADWGTASTISNPPTPVAAGVGCPSVTSLTGPNGIPVSNPIVHYAGSQPSLGQVIHRVPDGSATWQNNGVPSINSCNAACNVANTFQLNALALDPSCGADDGSISFAPTPAGTYSYDWNPSVSAGASATGLAAGTYQVEISDGSCTIDTTIILQEAQVFGVTANVTQPSCGVSDGLIDLDVSPSGSYTYNWTPNVSGTNIAEGLGASSYQIEISDGSCDWDTTIILVSPDAPELSLVVSNDISCNGLNDGEVEISISGGTGPFSWSSVPAGITGSISNNLAAGNYLVTVEDFNGCEVVLSVVINEPDALVLSVSSQAAECFEDNGEAAVSVSGGVGPYTYLWSPSNQTSSTLINIGSGTYAVTVTDANGCEGTAQVTVTVDGTGASLVITGTDISCFGLTDGSAEVVPTGTGPFSYSWTPSGGTNATATGLSGGSYTVEVTDGNGCVSNESIVINEPTDIDLVISSTPSDCTVDNGSATVVANGGTGGYIYSWTPGGGVTASIINLGPGIYTVVVADANGCEQDETVNVGTLNGPDITVNAVNDVSCVGEGDGSATISISGGTPGYTYDWTPTGGTAPSASGLSPGNYTVTVTDAAGCVAFEEVTIGEPIPISLSGMPTDSDCGLNNGSIDLMVTGGTGAYAYTWLPNVSMTPSATNLEAGDYTVTVTDANGCSADATYTVGIIDGLDVTIAPDNFTIEQGDNVDLIVTVVPNLTNLTYTWIPSDGLSCSDCPNPTASPNETTTYTVIVTSDDGCEGEAIVTIFVEALCFGAYLPTIFSPNEDGTNDALCLLSSCVQTMDLSIFNRWGERVFQSNSINNCWDGRHRGELVNSGVFVYKLRATLTNGETIEDSGNVTVVR